MKLNGGRGHASARQLGRALVDSEGGNTHYLTCVDDVLAQREARQAFQKAPQDPAAGTSTLALFREKLRAGLLPSDDIVALHLMDAFSK